MTAPPIQLWFEFASTYSHIAIQRVQPIVEAAGLELEWRPFLLGPVFKSQGWNDSPFNVYPVKGAYMWRDMERLAEQYRIPFRRPSRFPQSGLLAARVATAGEGEPWLADFVRGVYLANFAEDQDISNDGTLRSVLETAGCSAIEGVLARASSDDTKARLRERTEQAMSLGIFGAPTFVVGSELFWGQDRMADAIDWALLQ